MAQWQSNGIQNRRLWVQVPLLTTKSKRLLLSDAESVLMPERKQSGHVEARKAKRVGVKVVQFRGLAAPLRSEISRVGTDIRCG